MPQALLLLLLLSIPVFAQTGKVVGVTDGDTITVLSNRKQIKVRIAGIDAPETGQDYSQAAKRYLSSIVFNERVTLEGSKIDRYGRTVAKVLIDGRDVGLMMIHNGLAWHFKQYDREQTGQDRDLYSAAESLARDNRLNLWRYPNPVAPWDYRATKTPQPTSRQITVREPTRTPAFRTYSTNGQIIGNQNSMIYHLPGCRSYDKVAPKNRVYFRTAQEAERAGYRMAKNC